VLAAALTWATAAASVAFWWAGWVLVRRAERELEEARMMLRQVARIQSRIRQWEL
jgi:hypothetical protein